MTKHAKIERAQKLFLKALKEKYSRNPEEGTKTEKEIKKLKIHPTLIAERDTP